MYFDILFYGFNCKRRFILCIASKCHDAASKSTTTFCTMNLLPHLLKGKSAGANHILLNNITSISQRWIQTSCPSLAIVTPKMLRMKKAEHFKRIDGIEKNYDLIYKCPLHYFMNCAKLISALSASSVVSVACYDLITQGTVYVSLCENYGGLAVNSSELLAFSTAFFALNAFIFRYCCTIPLRLYKLENQYVVITPGLIPRYNNKYHFVKGQLKEHFNALSIFRGITYKANGKVLVLMTQGFRRAVDLYDMLDDSSKYVQRISDRNKTKD